MEKRNYFPNNPILKIEFITLRMSAWSLSISTNAAQILWRFFACINFYLMNIVLLTFAKCPEKEIQWSDFEKNKF